MPTYEYKCNACGHEFEAFQSIKDDPLTTCPRCGKDEVQRLISPGGGLIFKGSGFYITDYRSSSYKQAANKDSTPKPSSDSKPAGGGSSTSSTTKSD